MTLGAIAIPLVALAVCFGGMWFAWRLVSGAAREGEGGEDRDVAPKAVPIRKTRPRRRIGPALGLAGATMGLCGMTMSAARLAGADAPVLLGVVVSAVFALLGAGFLALLSRRRRHSEGIEGAEEDAAP